MPSPSVQSCKQRGVFHPQTDQSVRVWVSSPPLSPRTWPLPAWIGVQPWRLGRAKVVRPSPPYVVPSSEKSAWFWLIGRSCPLHNAQPFGAKLNETSRISAKNG